MNPVRIAIFAVAIFFFGYTGLSPVLGQSLPTASKSAELSVFAGYSPTRVDYGPYTLDGFSAGVDASIFPRLPFSPSLEVRGNYANAKDVTEKSLLFGPRLQVDLRRRIHPYADFLIGLGEISYHLAPYPNYTGDRSKSLAFGGGLNMDVARSFAFKVDIQQQHWNLGPNTALQPTGDYTLTPLVLTIGVTYTIPFRKLNRQGDFYR